MNEEIVIKTETVKVDELEGREKQIYEYAYNKGHEEAILENRSAISRILLAIAFFAFVTTLIVKCDAGF